MLTSAVSDETLRVLSDPLRGRIVELLAREQLCTCHLVEATGASQTNVSNHLRVLREAGVVQATPMGRYTYYRVLPDAIESAANHLHALANRARSTSERRRPCL